MRLIPIKPKPHQCGYFDDRDATFESFLLLEATDQEREMLLASGYRSFGKYVFRPMCVGCRACTPLRIPLDQFKPTKSQRRVLRRCSEIKVAVSKPLYTSEKWEIYKDHLRRFNRPEQKQEENDFIGSFYDPAIPSLEFCYYLEGRLVAVGIVNETPHALSSVYFTYRLEYAHYSLGTFSVMKEIEYGVAHGKRHLYLGYYIEDNHFMRYKGDFRPNEMLTESGRWVKFKT